MSKFNSIFKHITCGIFVAIPALLIAACGGTSSSPGSSGNESSPGAISFTITSPTEYPAGLPEPVTAYLTIYNNSNNNATNLVYPVVNSGDAGNTTKATITPNPTGVANNNCTSIPAHGSCQFTAVISPNAQAGTFTITATGNASASSLRNALTFVERKLGISNTFTASVTASIGLAAVPTGYNLPLYILPANQTIIQESGESTTAYLSILVESPVASAFNSITLYDNGVAITPTPVQQPQTSGNYSAYSVITFSFTIPSGATGLQTITASASNGNDTICGPSGSPCSESAFINLVQPGSGILSVTPSAANLTPTESTQTYTLLNIGQGNVSDINLPVSSSLFTVVSSCASSPFSLSIGESCTYAVTYNSFGNYNTGSENFPISYQNGTSGLESAISTIYYQGLPASANIVIESVVLTPAPTIGIGTEESPYYVESSVANESITLTYANIGNIDATNFAVTTGTPPSGYMLYSNGCSSVATLESNSGITCSVIYSLIQPGSAESLPFSLESSALSAGWTVGSTTVSNQAVNWANSNVTPIAAQESIYLTVYNTATVTASLNTAADGSGSVVSEVIPNESFYVVYTVTGGYPGQTTNYTATLSPGMGFPGDDNCTLTIASMLICAIQVNTGTASGSNLTITPISNGGTLPTPATTNPSSFDVAGTGSYGFVISNPSQILTYSVDAQTGGLSYIESYSIPTSGTVAGNIAVNESFVYAMVSGFNRQQVFIYNIHSNGHLTYIESMVVSPGSGIANIVIGNNIAYVADNTESNVYRYSIDSTTGLLTFIESTPVLAMGNVFNSAVNNQTNSYYNSGTLSTGPITWEFTYAINPENSNLTYTGESLNGDTHSFSGWAVNGNYAYVTYTITGTTYFVVPYTIASDGSLESAGTPIAATIKSLNPTAFGNYLYVPAFPVSGPNPGSVQIYQIESVTGALTATGESAGIPPIAGTFAPYGIAFYGPGIISNNTLSQGSIQQGESFTITLNLIDGAAFGNQVVTPVLSNSDTAITFSQPNCTLNTGDASCSIIVTVGANAIAESQVLTLSNSGNLSVNPATIRFAVKAPLVCGNGGTCKLFVTSSIFPGTSGGIAGADNTCNTDESKPNDGHSYRAVLVDGVNRQACMVPNGNCSTAESNNINWVLYPETTYISASNSNLPVFTTNLAGIFPYGSANNSMTPSTGAQVNYWTGMFDDWTTSGYNCSGWTASGQGTFGISIDQNAEQISTNPGGSPSSQGCGANLYLLCAESM